MVAYSFQRRFVAAIQVGLGIEPVYPPWQVGNVPLPERSAHKYQGLCCGSQMMVLFALAMTAARGQFIKQNTSLHSRRGTGSTTGTRCAHSGVSGISAIS